MRFNKLSALTEFTHVCHAAHAIIRDKIETNFRRVPRASHSKKLKLSCHFHLFRGEPRGVGGGPAARRGGPVLALAGREGLGAALDLLQLVLALPRLEEDLRVLPLLGLQENESE